MYKAFIFFLELIFKSFFFLINPLLKVICETLLIPCVMHDCVSVFTPRVMGQFLFKIILTECC